MGKIGLSVCYDTKNFGSQLQVLATIKKIEELGYETEIIRYKKKLTPVFLAQMLPRVFNLYFIRNKLTKKKYQVTIKKYPEILKNVKIRNERFSSFVNKYFTNLSNPYNGWETLVKGSAQNYDAFVCGSDQLWLPSNLGSHFYTLEFAPDHKPKIAYATSFGVKEIPWYQKKRTANYLRRFQSLSVRELAGSKIIEGLLEKKVQVVCDPTLLFDSEGWEKMVENKRLFSEPYVFCYFLGTNDEHRKAAMKLKEMTGLKLVSCPFLDNFVKGDQYFGDIQLYDMDAADFVNLIRHAEYILTDSFHGSVFSILHHKKFLTFNRFKEGKDSRNSRIDSLCTLLGLEGRRFQGDVLSVQREINYGCVDERLDNLRGDSIEYLRKSLSQGEHNDKYSR